MKSIRVWLAVTLFIGVAASLTAASRKDKRQVYYPSNNSARRSSGHRGTGHLPIAPKYPSPTPKSRPNYRAPQPVYQERPHDDSYEEESAIPGVAGVDYPIYNEVPYTKFQCDSVPYRPGMYANPEAGCQVYHVCHDDRFGPRGAEFLCTNGTVFNQETFSCDWWFNVDCNKATSFYDLNLDPEINPYNQKPYDGPLNLQYTSHEQESYEKPQPDYRSPNPFYRRS